MCSFCSPPCSNKKTALIDYILTVLSKLRVEHHGAATIISGNTNYLDESNMLGFYQAIFQIVKKPTREDKLRSIIMFGDFMWNPKQ